MDEESKNLIDSYLEEYDAYTEREICSFYFKGRDNRRNIIKVLTELTLIPKDIIIAILERNGYDVKKK